MVARLSPHRPEEYAHTPMGFQIVAAPRGSPRDQRTEWAYIFGAICPAKGKGAGLVMPFVRHRRHGGAPHRGISAAVDPGAHAVLIVDQAGWHLTSQAGDPRGHHRPGAAATIAAELNPVENVWQFQRDNWLSGFRI